MKPLLLTLACSTAALAAPPPPGTVIHHSPAPSGLYIGSPSLCLVDDRTWLASHDLFGPKSNEHTSPKGRIYQSADHGKTWTHLTDLDGFFWTNLFAHGGYVYAIGTDRHHGRLVIRQSADRGRTWTRPVDTATGIIAHGEWHTAPVPLIEHQGRLWRAVEDAMDGTKWGERYRARMISAAVDANLLMSSSWTITNPLPRDPAWLDGRFGAWLEGNAVVDPKGHLLNLLRVDKATLPEQAAVVRISADARTASFDPAQDFIPFDGGAKKFLIRQDPRGGGYWALSNIIPAAFAPGTGPGPNHPAATRNTLALVHSKDLRSWTTRAILLQHPDKAKHGFQYPDWHFDGDDLVAVVRTAWDDDHGGPHNNHDANFLTFHRWPNFRQLTRPQ